jgi:acetyl-CoA carboxylase biotin carboxyl carrier protein
MTQNELKELIELVAEKGFAEFEVERAGFKLKIVSSHPPVLVRPDVVSPIVQPLIAPLPAPIEIPASSQPPLAPAAIETTPAPAAPPADADTKVMRSPIVGTFYRAPGPTSESFVKVGDRVEVGKVLCIVEAMKLMNEIESEFAGEIVKVFVENGQPVEYGQPLFGIRP